MYLRNTFHVADKHSRALAFHMTPPSETDRRIPEPQELLMAASVA
jgi:hypothetical protein